MGTISVPSEIQGRKIFFLNPTGSVQQQIIEELIQQEFEVYIAKDHVKLAQALKKYSDSIVFLNIDEGMREPEWEKWIRGIMLAMPNVDIGVFSSNTDEKIRLKYLNDVHVPCGYTALKLDMSKSVSRILEILKIVNAKGLRKYIRATMENETSATLNLPVQSNFVNGLIKDISVVGVSCTFEHDPELTKNTLFKDIQIRLQSMLLKVEAIAFGSRMDGNEKIYVLLFTQRIDPDVRTKIRKYIQLNLQNKMDADLK